METKSYRIKYKDGREEVIRGVKYYYDKQEHYEFNSGDERLLVLSKTSIDEIRLLSTRQDLEEKVKDLLIQLEDTFKELRNSD